MKKLGKTKRNWLIFSILFVSVMIATLVILLASQQEQTNRVSYTEFLKKVEANDVQRVTIDLEAKSFQFQDKEKGVYTTDNPRIDTFKEFLLKQNIDVQELNSQDKYSWIVVLSVVFLLFLLFMAMMRRHTAQTSMQQQLVERKQAEVTTVPSTTFDHIAGNESIKKDVRFIIDFLKNPQKYEEIGARMPKGIILYGPPGTGKTLIAKAVAGEAGVPFFSVSGSDFVEMYVGVGAKRVRELFEDARKKAPCIIFIDEMDAVGKKRGQDNNSEKDHTINALLTQLDGFSDSEGIVVIGATNRMEDLDEALVRPGRFDRHIAVPLPDIKERREILSLHMKNKKIKDEVNLDVLSKMTIGFSGAGLETLANESAIIAVSKGKEQIDDEDIDDAYFRIVMKGNKKEAHSNQDELRLVAWHEAGHALAAKLLTKKSVPKVTIIPSTSGAGGVTFIIPEKAGLHTKKDLINEIKTLYAGRIAEYLLLGDEELITIGASQDIKQATSLIVQMIRVFGMSDTFGMLYVDSAEQEVLEEAKKISSCLYEETLKLMEEKKGVLKAIALALINKETLIEEELDSILLQYA